MKTVTYDELLWKLVPVEPTEEMLNCGPAPANDAEKFAADLAAGYRKNIWAAMLASTPAPAQQERTVIGYVPMSAVEETPLDGYVPVYATDQRQERKPMTNEQAVKCIEDAGFKTWTSAHFRLVRQAERHHGIKE